MTRILVFMSDNRNLDNYMVTAQYNSLAAAINYEYCKIHGYNFIYYRPYLYNKDEINLINCVNPVTGNGRHSSWSKLLTTKLALQSDYDYVVYIDSDCIFKDFNQKLEEFIKPYADKDILFLNDKPWSDTMPCAGFYICKINEYVKQFVFNWYNYNIPHKDKNHAWEQNALYALWDNVCKSYNIGVIDSWMFEEKEKQFLRHIGSAEYQNRLPYFTSFIQSKNINYERNINEIQVIPFDTRN